VKAFVL